MKILFLSHYFYPHIGGVERHLYEVSQKLKNSKNKITIITEKYDKSLKNNEMVGEIRVIRVKYPKIKFLGLVYIWHFLWQKRSLILESDVIHIHDVFIWYLPFRFMYPAKKVYITIHGLEWGKPFSKMGIWQKKLAVKLASGSIGVGKFLEKYLDVKFNKIIYGAVDVKSKIQITNSKKISNSKVQNSCVFVGRLKKDTGVLEFLKYLKTHKNLKVDFVGDGSLRKDCEKYGIVHGFSEPEKFLERAEYAVPGGYLACLEAMAAKCKIKVFWHDSLKKDYWQMSPMYKFILEQDINGAFEWVKKQSLEKLANEYISLYNHI